MALHIANTDNVTDSGALELEGAGDVTTAVVAGTTYLFVASSGDNGVSVFAVEAGGTLVNVDNVADDATLELAGAAGVTTAVIAGTTYLFVTGRNDDGVSVFSVAADGTLTNVTNVTDGGTRELDGASGITTVVVEGNTNLAVAGSLDNGVTMFSVGAGGTLTNVDNFPDGLAAPLDGAIRMTTSAIAGTDRIYMFVTSINDDAVAAFIVDPDGTLTYDGGASDNATLELDVAAAVTAAVIAGTTYLFVAGHGDDGVSVFSVHHEGALTNVDNVTDDATLLLNSPIGLTTAVIGGVTYLFVTTNFDNSITVFSVAANGTLTNVTTLSDNATLELNSAGNPTTAVVDGVTYLFVPGQSDNGVSVFSLAGSVPLLGDVLWQHSDGTVATAGHEFPAVPPTFQIRGTGDFDGDGDVDIVWQHEQGLVVTWEMENGDLLATHSLAQVSNSFHIAETGDFDNDGDADILWRHDQGAVVIWEMENGALVTNHNLPAVSNSFQVAGTGDFDSDGDADILWRHSSGLVVIWEIEDAALVTNRNLPVVSNSFQVAEVGDFDRDGDADILWRHTSGVNVIWEMEGGAFVTNHNLPQVSNSFQVAGTEDFDSDGDADIVWRHQEGQVVTWTMENNALVQAQNFGVVPNAWQIRGTGEFDLA